MSDCTRVRLASFAIKAWRILKASAIDDHSSQLQGLRSQDRGGSSSLFRSTIPKGPVFRPFSLFSLKLATGWQPNGGMPGLRMPKTLTSMSVLLEKGAISVAVFTSRAELLGLAVGDPLVERQRKSQRVFLGYAVVGVSGRSLTDPTDHEVDRWPACVHEG